MKHYVTRAMVNTNELCKTECCIQCKQTYSRLTSHQEQALVGNHSDQRSPPDHNAMYNYIKQLTQHNIDRTYLNNNNNDFCCFSVSMAYTTLNKMATVFINNICSFIIIIIITDKVGLQQSRPAIQ